MQWRLLLGMVPLQLLGVHTPLLWQPVFIWMLLADHSSSKILLYLGHGDGCRRLRNMWDITLPV
jgi:hypothetical protein